MEPTEKQKEDRVAVDLTNVDGMRVDFENEETDWGSAATAIDAEVDGGNTIDHADRSVTPVVASQLPARPQSFAKIEKSLASLGFFTPSSRRIKNQKMKRVSFTRDIDGKRLEVSAEIHPSGAFGLPITADQDKYLALQKIITNTLQADGKVSNPIRFKSSELLRLLNSSTKTGKNYKSISEWLDVMSGTMIISNGAAYAAGRKGFVRDRLHVFDRAVSFGKEMDDGTVADANYIWLSAWQLENINNKFLMPIDLETYRELKNHIAKALVPLLQIWLFASHKAATFEKRYNELCEILTLQTYRAPSQILRQFKPSLDELTMHGYIEKWRIEKTSDKKSYKVVFFHGPKFHRDRKRRLEQKDRMEEPIVVGEFEATEPGLPEPGQADERVVSKSSVAATKSAEVELPKNHDVRGSFVDDLSARGLMPSAVLRLFESLPSDRFDLVPDYIEYWDSVHREGSVGPGLLFDLIRNGSPLPATFQTKKQKAEKQAAEERRQKAARVMETLKADYEKYCQRAIDEFIADELSAEEFERRVAASMATSASEPGFWNERPLMAEQLARHGARAEIAKKIGLPSFEDFCRRGVPVFPTAPQDPEKLGTNAAENALSNAGGLSAPMDGTPTVVPPPDGLPTMSSPESPRVGL